MGAWFDDKNLYIEFEGDDNSLRIKKATDKNGTDITNKFGKAKKVKHHKPDGGNLDLPNGTVLVTQNNPTCYWVRCGDGWYVYCW